MAAASGEAGSKHRCESELGCQLGRSAGEEEASLGFSEPGGGATPEGVCGTEEAPLEEGGAEF